MFACCQKCQAHSLWFSPICCDCLNKYAYLQWSSTVRRTGQMKDLPSSPVFLQPWTPNTMSVQRSIQTVFLIAKILLKCTAELLTLKCCEVGQKGLSVTMWLFEEEEGKLWLWRHTHFLFHFSQSPHLACWDSPVRPCQHTVEVTMTIDCSLSQGTAKF